MAARAVTSDELIILRSDRQWSRLYLAILQPRSIYTARLLAVPSSTDRVAVITFTSGVGTLGDVLTGMTLYVGTSAGAFDLGMCRIRKAPIAGTFYIGETSEIDWEASAYLTVMDDFGLWEKPMHNAAGALKADYDLAYSNQHTSWDPMPMMGPDAVIQLGDDPVAVSFPEAANSWVIGSTISSYAFTSDGGAWTNPNTAGAVLTVSAYPTGGHINVYLTVTAANGKSFTGHRYVHVFDASHPPVAAEVEIVEAGYENGGWSFEATLYDNAGSSTLREGTQVILFAKDYYDGTEQSLGPVAGRENLICVGRVAEEELVWDADSGKITLKIYGPQHWLGKLATHLSGLGFASSGAWDGIPAMTTRMALFHLLHWRSTVTKVMDVTLTSDTRRSPEAVASSNTIWAQVRDIAWRSIFAKPGCDRFGRLYVEIEPQMVPEASRTWATVMEITGADHYEEVRLSREPQGKCSEVFLTSMAVSAAGEAGSLYSLAMGHIQARHGEPEVVDKVLAASQAASNQLAGLLMGWKNNEIPEILYMLAENNRMFDLWPRQFADLVVASADTPRELEYVGHGIPRLMRLRYDPESGDLTTEIGFEAETFEQLAVNGDIPKGDGTEDIFSPMPPMPPFPPIPTLPPVILDDEDNQPSLVPAWLVGKGFWYTGNFNDPDDAVVWNSWNAGLDATAIANDLYWGFDVSRVSGRGFMFGYGGSLWSSPYPGQPWTRVFDQTFLIDQIGLGAADHPPYIACIGVNRGASDRVFVIAGNSFSVYEGTTAAFLGSSAGVTKVWEISSHNHEYSVSQDELGFAVYGYSAWLALWKGTTQKILVQFDASGNLVTKYDLGNIAADMGYLARGGMGGQCGALWNVGTPAFRKIDANGGTLTGITGLTPYQVTYDGFLSVACDPSGLFMVGLDNNVAAPNLKISSDGGVSWSQPGLWSGVGRAAENCGDAERWIIQAANGIYYSGDFWTTWIDKTGDLLSKAGVAVNMQAFIVRCIA